jgi:hypothetical protein
MKNKAIAQEYELSSNKEVEITKAYKWLKNKIKVKKSADILLKFGNLYDKVRHIFLAYG